MTRHPIRHALRRDLDSVVAVWVDAFTDDPFLRWIQPDDEAWPAFGSAWLSFIADLLFERGHTYVSDPPGVAAGWVPPDVALVGPEELARGRSIVAAHAGDEKADEVFSTIVRAREHTLDESHWTLQYIGVRRDRQGCGLGAIAVSAILGACDSESLPCGLVSTNARNISFYERLGFRVAAEISTPDGKAVLRPMHRPPNPA